MDFEKAFKNVQAGKASPAEIKFVDEEIMKVQKAYQGKKGAIPGSTNDGAITPENIAEKCRRGAINKIIIIAIVILLCIGLLIFFLVRNTYEGAEKNNKYTKDQAIELAIDAAAEATGLEKSAFTLNDVDREMVNGQKKDESYYQYDIELVNGTMEVEVIVNAKNGETIVTDIDYD